MALAGQKAPCCRRADGTTEPLTGNPQAISKYPCCTIAVPPRKHHMKELLTARIGHHATLLQHYIESACGFSPITYTDVHDRIRMEELAIWNYQRALNMIR